MKFYIKCEDSDVIAYTDKWEHALTLRNMLNGDDEPRFYILNEEGHRMYAKPSNAHIERPKSWVDQAYADARYEKYGI